MMSETQDDVKWTQPGKVTVLRQEAAPWKLTFHPDDAINMKTSWARIVTTVEGYIGTNPPDATAQARLAAIERGCEAIEREIDSLSARLEDNGVGYRDGLAKALELVRREGAG